VALARKIAVLAWAMLRDEKDWDPKTMIHVTESFGKMNPKLKESLATMKPKENSDQRKSRIRREARLAKEAASEPQLKASASEPPTKPGNEKPKGNLNKKHLREPKPKPRRARKLVSAG
jgi:hypothetical protein